MRRVSLLLMALLPLSPAAAQVAAPSPFESARGVPAAAGAWTYRALPGFTEAVFAGRFMIRCDRMTRQVMVQRLEAGMSPAGPMTISTDSATRSFGGTTVSLRADDALLDAIAFSRGRFVVSGSGGSLLIPAWPEAARSIEDCRN